MTKPWLITSKHKTAYLKKELSAIRAVVSKKGSDMTRQHGAEIPPEELAEICDAAARLVPSGRHVTEKATGLRYLVREFGVNPYTGCVSVIYSPNPGLSDRLTQPLLDMREHFVLSDGEDWPEMEGAE